jgi:hypothetical protein
MVTFAPCSTRFLATAIPIPEVPPVINAFLFFKEYIYIRLKINCSFWNKQPKTMIVISANIVNNLTYNAKKWNNFVKKAIK